MDRGVRAAVINDGTTGSSVAGGLESQGETLAGSFDDLEAGLEGEDDALEGAPEPAPDPAQIGRFVVLRRLGAGGMGVVYAAYDNELDRKLAIKLVRAERAGPDVRARVRREAQAMARLSHPNVVQIYEISDQ
ncbi:protein kinase [Pseudenhygromyxa sp. WMMC2535]|uniref:protein kinase domain-containing protein n=1 Tax=Pseudenhygromyxa sp. WMMC2535 TaxID=2712867 RepID=UPI001553FD34|nr:protein kinase [Pseudenhygromyxa sp. WMMC2535]NVB36222.1 protein kinase [Pseudenhygromyxa sp. WMMC2535]